MSEEIPMKSQASEPGAEILVIQDTLDKFIATADVEVVYGEPIQHGDTVIVPTAEVLAGLGFGLVYNSGKRRHEKNQDEGSRGGGGGGGRVFSRPVAVVVASPEGVRVEPVVDLTKIGLAALTAAAFMFRMMRITGQRGVKLE